MGNWGQGPFENDAAYDLVAEVMDGGGFNAIQAAFAKVREGRLTEDQDDQACSLDRLWGSDWEAAVAAAELVAAAAGAPTRELPEQALEWLERVTRDSARALVPIARNVVEDALTKSELRELRTQDDGKVDCRWEASVRDLLHRLDRLIAYPVAPVASRKPKRWVRPRVGDVFTIPLADGLFHYGQYVYEHSNDGSLVQIFRAATPKVVSAEQAVASGPLFAPVYVGLREALRLDRWQVIGHVPVEGFIHPLFRSHANPYPGRNTPRWWLWDGMTATQIGELPEKYRSLEFRISYGYLNLEKRIIEGQSVYDSMW